MEETKIQYVHQWDWLHTCLSRHVAVLSRPSGPSTPPEPSPLPPHARLAATTKSGQKILIKGSIAGGCAPNLPFPWVRVLAPTWFLGPTRVYISNGISICSAILAQLMVMSNRHRHIGNNGPHLCPLFLGPTWVHSSNSTFIGSAIFVGLTAVSNRQTQTDRQTYRPCYIGNNRLHLTTCTAM